MEPMNRLSLLWVWASISAASWMGPTAGSQPTPGTALPPAPKLSLSPPYSIFAPGERVRLTCSPPEGRTAEQFQFYKLQPRGRWEMQVRQEEDTWEITTTHLEPESTFGCSYNERNRATKLLQSAPSNHAVVSVELPPAALSLDPKFPVYLQEERVTLTCSAPEGQQVSGYLFFKEQKNRTLKELPDKGQGPYEAFRVSRSTAGKYSCAYWILHSNREIRSPHSGLVSIVMTERPRPPVFSVSPEQKIYSSGEFISLTCVVPDRHNVSKIVFLKDSQRLHAIQLPSSPDDFTHVFQLLPQDGGRYSCKYQAVKSEREIPSPTSDVILISVMVPESPTAVLPVHTYETIAGVANSPGAPASPALQLTSSQLPPEENSRSAEPDGPVTPVPRSAQPSLHDSISSRADSWGTSKPLASQGSTVPLASQGSTIPLDSQGSTMPLDSQGSTMPWDSQQSTMPLDSQGSTISLDSRGSTTPLDFRGSTMPLNTRASRKNVLSSGDPRSTSQTRTVSESENGNTTQNPGRTLDHPLVVGCSAAGVLFLLLLACLFMWKQRDKKKKLSRSFWKTLDGQQSRQMSRIYRSSRTQLDLQETAKPQEPSQDWGILPKSKAVSSKCRGPSKQSQAEDDADSGAEFEFPDTDPTYTLLGYSCSTFFHPESNPPDNSTHVYEESL